jgi:hypothetical protein
MYTTWRSQFARLRCSSGAAVPRGCPGCAGLLSAVAGTGTLAVVETQSCCLVACPNAKRAGDLVSVLAGRAKPVRLIGSGH